jgi:hypothetical protein
LRDRADESSQSTPVLGVRDALIEGEIKLRSTLTSMPDRTLRDRERAVVAEIDTHLDEVRLLSEELRILRGEMERRRG